MRELAGFADIVRTPKCSSALRLYSRAPNRAAGKQLPDQQRRRPNPNVQLRLRKLEIECVQREGS